MFSFVYINHGGRPDVKVGSHEGENPGRRLADYRAERGVTHSEQYLIPVPKGMAQKVERLAHRLLRENRVSNNTELFYVTLDEAKLAVLDALNALCVKGINPDAQDSDPKHLSQQEKQTHADLQDCLYFDVVHGNSVEERRDPSKLNFAIHEATTRPSKGGRKLEAIFEAQNHNGLLWRYRRRFGSLESEDPIVQSAIEYLVHFGGSNCVATWPNRVTLDGSFQVLERIMDQTLK